MSRIALGVVAAVFSVSFAGCSLSQAKGSGGTVAEATTATCSMCKNS